MVSPAVVVPHVVMIPAVAGRSGQDEKPVSQLPQDGAVAVVGANSHYRQAPSSEMTQAIIFAIFGALVLAALIAMISGSSEPQKETR